MHKNDFVEDWKKACRKQISVIRPDLSKEQIEKYLDKVIEKKLVNPVCELDNNYIHKTVKTNLLGLYKWIKDSKPIIAGYGVFFKNQEQAENPEAIVTIKLLNERSAIKKEMFSYPEDSYEYKHKDMLQGDRKVCANSLYGAGGAKTSQFYNLYCAGSTTGTAQSLISTTTMAFEAFLGGNDKFYDMDDCMLYIQNIAKEKREVPFKFIKTVTVETVFNHLSAKFYDRASVNTNLLYRVLYTLDKETLTRVYYKNNLYKFIMGCTPVCSLLDRVMNETEKFNEPKRSAMSTKLREEMDILVAYFLEYVFYNYPSYNRIYKLKKDIRKTTLVIDTDSNMNTIDPWINMMDTCFTRDSNEKSEDELRTIATNAICYIKTCMINDALHDYCTRANVLEEFKHRINMKNEFLMGLLITTLVKKCYLSSLLLREGKPMNGRLDIKGLSFVKSSMSPTTGKFLKDIIKEDIFGDEINVPNIIRKLDTFTNSIRDSINNGETTFLKPASVKAFDKYKEPLSEMPVRAVLGWNSVYQEEAIILPENINIAKVNMTRLKDIESLEQTNPQIYNRLVKEIFENRNKDISNKGLNAFAIPQTVNKIPEWLIPFIDIENIIEDNVGSFYPVLKSLGLSTIKTRSTNEYYSNMVQL